MHLPAQEMTINIVTEAAPGWALRRVAASFAEHLPNCSLSTISDPYSKINFYVNYALFTTPTICDIGFFTHREGAPPYNEVFDQTARAVDGCVAMCDRTASLLNPAKTQIIKIPPDPQFQKSSIVFGVVAREYPSGRKRFELIPRLREIPGVELIITNGDLRFEEMPDFYRKIDYLLILSSNEGGPLPVLEALSMGKPVISPDVGFAWDYPVIRYNTFEELLRIITALTPPKDAWATAARQLYQFFQKTYATKYS